MAALSLLSSQARVQVPWIKVTLGKYTFGVYDKATRQKIKTAGGTYSGIVSQYPEYIRNRIKFYN